MTAARPVNPAPSAARSLRRRTERRLRGWPSAVLPTRPRLGARAVPAPPGLVRVGDRQPNHPVKHEHHDQIVKNQPDEVVPDYMYMHRHPSRILDASPGTAPAAVIRSGRRPGIRPADQRRSRHTVLDQRFRVSSYSEYGFLPNPLSCANGRATGTTPWSCYRLPPRFPTHCGP